MGRFKKYDMIFVQWINERAILFEGKYSVKYILVDWSHDFPDELTMLLSEIDEKRSKEN